jgi:hypothetical protein
MPPERFTVITTYVCQDCTGQRQTTFGKGPIVEGKTVRDWCCNRCLNRRHGAQPGYRRAA